MKALDAKTGKVLWKFNVGTGILQSPMTYTIGGKQYLAVVAGRTKARPRSSARSVRRVIDASPEGGVLVVFELGS